jgi:hypothetical protein
VTVDETLRSQADYLDALAAAIRTVNARLDNLTRTDLEARLGVGGPVHSDMGPVPSALFGQSGPAHTLGNTAPFIGQTNALPDPTWQGLDINGVLSGAGVTRVSSKWSCHHVLNSGVLPATHSVFGAYYRRGSDPFNSDQISLEVGGFGANAADLDLFLYPTSPYTPGSTGQMALPYLVAAIRYSHQDTTPGDATVSLTLQIVRVDTGAIVAESDALDPFALSFSDVRQLLVSTAQTAALFTSTSWLWRLRVHVVKPASSTIYLALTFGEPQLHFAYTPDALAFAPIIGAWNPDLLLSERANAGLIVESRKPADTTDLFVIQSDGLVKWGPGGAAALDVRLQRSAAAEMTMDGGGPSAPVAMKLIGRRVAVPKAAQTVVAGTAIAADYEVVQINSAGNVTMTAAPTIADGADGQMLTILNVDTADTVTLQDQGTLAGSNLRLTAATVALGPRQSIHLMYSATVGDWVQLGNLVSVL